MEIRRLIFENFCVRGTCEIDFHDQVSMVDEFVLDGAAIALGAWFAGTSLARKESVRILIKDATDFPVRISAERGGKIWSCDLRNQSHRMSISPWVQEESRDLERRAIIDSGQPLPLMVFYGGLTELQDCPPAEPVSRMDGYQMSLNPARSHTRLESWMRWREYDRVQRGISPHLEGVEESVKNCVTGIRHFGYNLIRQRLEVGLSSGEVMPLQEHPSSNLITIIADIARRSATLNPIFGKNASERTSGVVLVRGRDIAEVLPRILATFPRIQFISGNLDMVV